MYWLLEIISSVGVFSRASPSSQSHQPLRRVVFVMNSSILVSRSTYYYTDSVRVMSAFEGWFGLEWLHENSIAARTALARYYSYTFVMALWPGLVRRNEPGDTRYTSICYATGTHWCPVLADYIQPGTIRSGITTGDGCITPRQEWVLANWRGVSAVKKWSWVMPEPSV